MLSGLRFEDDRREYGDDADFLRNSRAVTRTDKECEERKINQDADGRDGRRVQQGVRGTSSEQSSIRVA